MCGIVAYVGGRTAYPIIVKGLQRLEYRGYDSAGLALINSEINVYKCKGKVKDLENHTKGKSISGSIGMGHTRWATHGEPSDSNAHPHVSQNGKFIVVHNGIIENYAHLKKELISRGYEFQSETDTEVLANLIENIYINKEVNAEMAVRLALTKVVGAYGLVITCTDEKDQLIAARKGSPLVIGVGEKEYFLASDATPIVEYTDQVIYMNDEEVAVIKKDNLTLKSIENDALKPKIQKVNLTIDEIDKGDFEHFMLKEIYEQPISIEDTFRGRIAIDHSKIFLGGIADILPKLSQAKRIIIAACGT
ncbi:MAG: class II glutamine amidotransferase, partial [Bacteroidales bacterium]|nr:class II glutamine amidotransferase [Bacteroidales bacterium]